MEEKREAVAAQDKLPVSINFQGATGLMARSINGIYKRQESTNALHPDKIFYRFKPTSNNCPTLWYNSSDRWVVMLSSNVLAYCGLTGLPSPCDAKRWYIANSAQSFFEQPTVTVTNVDAKFFDTKQLKISTRPERRSRFSSHSRISPSFSSRRMEKIRKRLFFTAGMTMRADEMWTHPTTHQVEVPPQRKRKVSRYMQAVARMARMRGKNFK